MMELAKSHKSDIELTQIRTTGEPKIAKKLQPVELEELTDATLAYKKRTERAGFEPAVLLRAHWFSKPARSAAPTPLHLSLCMDSPIGTTYQQS